MVKLNKIYTRTGDDGTTGLVSGERIRKDAPRMTAVGDVDELNSAIGVAIVALTSSLGGDGDGDVAKLLLVVQNDLFDLGADFATPLPAAGASDEPWALRITADQVARLEREIDQYNDALPPLDSFVLPGGTAAAAGLHLARAIARRAERSAIAAQADVGLNTHALVYLNRLSDLLFVLARHANVGAGGDVKWVPGASRGA